MLTAAQFSNQSVENISADPIAVDPVLGSLNDLSEKYEIWQIAASPNGRQLACIVRQRSAAFRNLETRDFIVIFNIDVRSIEARLSVAPSKVENAAELGNLGVSVYFINFLDPQNLLVVWEQRMSIAVALHFVHVCDWRRDEWTLVDGPALKPHFQYNRRDPSVYFRFPLLYILSSENPWDLSRMVLRVIDICERSEVRSSIIYVTEVEHPLSLIIPIIYAIDCSLYILTVFDKTHVYNWAVDGSGVSHGMTSLETTHPDPLIPGGYPELFDPKIRHRFGWFLCGDFLNITGGYNLRYQDYFLERRVEQRDLWEFHFPSLQWRRIVPSDFQLAFSSACFAVLPEHGYLLCCVNAESMRTEIRLLRLPFRLQKLQELAWNTVKQHHSHLLKVSREQLREQCLIPDAFRSELPGFVAETALSCSSSEDLLKRPKREKRKNRVMQFLSFATKHIK